MRHHGYSNESGQADNQYAHVPYADQYHLPYSPYGTHHDHDYFHYYNLESEAADDTNFTPPPLYKPKKKVDAPAKEAEAPAEEADEKAGHP